MPKQKLTGSSSLLTPHGWRKLCYPWKTGTTVGVDRFGKLSEKIVSADCVGELDRVAYIGSKEAFGQFHPESRLIDSDGVSRSVHELIESNLVGECRFENAYYADNRIPSDEIVNNLWADLKASAVVRREGQLFLAARGNPPSNSNTCFELLRDDNDWPSESLSLRYVRIVEKGFTSAMLGSWRDTICDLAGLMFEVSEDGVITFDRESYIWCLWRQLLQEESSGHAGELSYDSLQHTSVIHLNLKPAGLSSGLSKGGTAFFRNEPEREYEIGWDDSSWCPVSSGFILPAH